MCFKISTFYLFLIWGVLIINNCVSSDEVPTMLWNIKGNSLSLKPVPALAHNDKILQESIHDAIQQDAEVLIFAVNKLSLEDFYLVDKPVSLNNTLNNVQYFLDLQPHILLSSVSDPLSIIHQAPCGVQEIVVDDKIDDNILLAVSKAFQSSCVVILHVSDEGIIKDKGMLQNVFLPFEKSNKNMIGIFTGVKSSWSGSDEDHHIFRNLLQAEAPESSTFINFTGNIIMYADNAAVRVGSDNATLQFPPNTDGSSSGNSTVLQMKFKATGSFSSVTLKFNFEKKFGSWKTVGFIKVEGQDELPLKSEFISAPIGFSYSCGQLVIKGKNSSRNVQITMDRFQIQPFGVKEVFSDSFDCVPFFTVPIWMGIIVALIFIVILNIGVYALFSVKTMDRFDDPKGKTISVGAVAD